VAKLPPDRQGLFIDVLGQQADAAAQPALLAIAKSGEKTVRVAAIRALVQIGSASLAPALVQLLGDSEREIAQAAQDGLAALPGNQVDAAVTAMLAGTETSLRLEGIGLVGRRRMTSAMPAILKATGDATQQVRLAAIKALGDLAGQAELPALLNLLLNAKDAQDMEAAEQALAAVCARSDEASIEKLSGQLAQAQPAQKCALLRVLRTAAGDRALPTVRAAVKDSNAEVHSAAVRILCEWKIAEVAPDLLELAKSSANANEQTLCLRAYIGLAGVRGVPGPEKMSICKQAAAMVQRDAEKKLLLGVLAGITTAESLALVTPYLDTPAIAEEACSAAVTIAEKIGGSRGLPAVTAAMQKVVQVTKNADLANRANAVLKGAPPKPAEKAKGAGKKKK
jgi:HEAT repeat protein